MAERTVWSTRLESMRFTCSCFLIISEEIYHEKVVGSEYLPSDSPSLIEDCTYWYVLEITDPTVLGRILPSGRLIRRSPRSQSEGVLSTQSQAGVLRLEIELVKHNETETLVANIDVYPAKFDIATFRTMIDDICKHSLSLTLRLSSSTSVPLKISDFSDESGVAQRFFFIRHLLDDTCFQLALEQVTKNPHTRIERELSSRLLTSAKRLDGRSLRALASGRDRMRVPTEHSLSRLGSLPRASLSLQPVETLDNSENRFIRFALREFSETLAVVAAVCIKSNKAQEQRIADEAKRLEAQLRTMLDHPTLRDIGESSMLPLGSPVLHGRPGYRKIFEAWLQFHIAASLRWEESADIFGAGKRDTDKLYEYWLFFQLLTIMETELGVAMPQPSELVSQSADGFLLQLKAGRSFVHQGTTLIGSNPLTVRFSYNRTFSANSDELVSGSWSLTMRPDFTISFWPAEIDAKLAEQLHLTVHLHFDAKYRLSDALEETTEAQGSYKREDLFVAHTYRDAIRRSPGAFIIYPGGESSPTLYREYHEMMPGVGAFPVRPTAGGQPNGIQTVGKLLRHVVEHFSDPLAFQERLRHVVWATLGSFGNQAVNEMILMTDASDCFTLSSNANEMRFAIRLSGFMGKVISAAHSWKICSHILIENNAGSSFLLIPITSAELNSIEISSIDPRHGTNSTEICVVVQLSLQSAVQVKPKNQSSISDLKKFARTYFSCCVTMEIFNKFALVI